MDIMSLVNCFTNPSALVVQIINSLIIAMVLFLVASGLSLILGVMGVMNFAHGSLFMMGAYLTYSVMSCIGYFGIAMILVPIGVGVIGVILERVFIKRVYGLDQLYQLLLTYAFILVFDDVVKLIWGSFDLSVAMPSTFRRPPFFILEAPIPSYYVYLIVVGILLAIGMHLLIGKTKFGKMIRAAAMDPEMLMCVGINVPLIYTGVFALGSFLAGLGAIMAAPLRPMSPGMGLAVIIESLVIVVIGGMGNILGTFAVALIFGFMRSFGILGFPSFEMVFIYLLMVVVLIIRPTGLFGRVKV
jgi:branched-chain amino acid transport system permease protein